MSHNIVSKDSQELSVVNNNAELIKSLRELASFFERNPQFPEYRDSINVSYFLYADWNLPDEEKSKEVKRRMADFARHFGKAKKEADASYFKLVRMFGTKIQLKAYTMRENICVKVETGRMKKVPARPAQIIEAIAEHEEPEVEWKCPDSLLDA